MSRVQIEIFIGTVLILATSLVVVVYGLNEQSRMARYELDQHARAVEEGAALFEAQCSRCHGTQGLGIPGLCPPLNDRYFFDQRLKDINWSGTLEDYIVATASSGRLVSTRPQNFPGEGTPAMPSFGDSFGGPLRQDQIRSIAAFVTNWESTATLVEVPQAPAGPTVGTDITKQLPEGDSTRGEALANKLACTACHIAAPTGPAWLASGTEPGIGTRASTRYTQADYQGKAQSPEQYLFESIVQPGAYVVSGFPENLMPPNYGNQLTDQDLADLIAYLLSLK
jgi:mono/diheme cytochrome c family protein